MKKILLQLFFFLLLLNIKAENKISAYHIMHPLAQINYVKEQIKNKKDPYYPAYLKLLFYADSIQSLNHHAIDVFSIPGYYYNPQIHHLHAIALQEDAFSAYCSALSYRLSGEKKYGEKACFFLNAWANINKSYCDRDGALVMTYSGSALLMAAELMEDTNEWNDKDAKIFKQWVSNVYKKAAYEIRLKKDNLSDWGQLGAILSASLLKDKTGIKQNIKLVSFSILSKIAEDGHMRKEVLRGKNGIWYSYFSLAPMTVSCWLIYNITGKNFFNPKHKKGELIKKALDYLFYYNKHPSEWTWAKSPKVGDHTWPDNLYESMGNIYNDSLYIDYVKPSRPHISQYHHFAWVFPTLMPSLVSKYGM